MSAKAQSGIPEMDRPRNGNGSAQGVDGRPQASAVGEAAYRIQESIAYMRQNLDRPLQVATLAARVNVSASHFFVLFKRHTGSAPIDYFVRLRMEKAQALLDTTELSVKEAATALGYVDPFHFSRVFKSVVGVSPSNYRARQCNGLTGVAGKPRLDGMARFEGVETKTSGLNGTRCSLERVKVALSAGWPANNQPLPA